MSAAACGVNGATCAVCSGLQGTCFNGACRCDVCASGCPYASVQAAVADMNGLATITICPGIYREDVTISRSLTLIGAGDGDGAGATVLQGTGARSVMAVNDGQTVSLQELRITGGNGDQGGGIYNRGALTVKDSTVTGNNANNGGGIWNDGSVTMTGCFVSENASGGGFGGGIAHNGRAFTLESTTISDNSATGGSGGGIFSFASSGLLTLNRCTVELNTALLYGGGLDIEGQATLDHTHVVLNSAGYLAGGIFENPESGAVVTLNHSVVSGNTATNCEPAGAVPGCVG